MVIPLVRAQHVNIHIEILRDIGAPVDRYLEMSRLPVWIAEVPHEYVSLWRATDCVTLFGRDMPVSELGFLAARSETIASFSKAMQRAVLGAPTGALRLEAFERVAPTENTNLKVRSVREGENIRVSCETPSFLNSPVLACIEWMNIEATISLMRSICGPDWCPIEITFIAKGRVCDGASEIYGNTRILTGQTGTSILLRAEDLAGTCATWLVGGTDEGRLPVDPPVTVMEELALTSAVRALIRPYLRQGNPDLAMIAEIACMSRRTLQRRLEQCGRSFSSLVKEARFEVASGLLADASNRIVDIAFATGYENAQHFSRAFRQFTGIAPGDYRRRHLGSEA